MSTQWNFRHIEFLIDIAEDCRETTKLSATRLKRFLELKAAGVVQDSTDHDGKYAQLTTEGKFIIETLEQDLNDYIRGIQK